MTKSRSLRTNGEEAAYVALSHCWAKHQPLTTKKGTLQQRKKGIPLVNVPQAFQDAILVTRKLGIGYLWIGSLCIIQNDSDDWVREAARKCSVYQNATLTISADAARGSTQGLLKQVSARRFSPAVALPVSGNDLNSNPVYIREIAVGSWERPGELGGLHLMDIQRAEPLLGRAWVLQEWLLSRRISHFCSGELFWECNTPMQCEYKIRGVPICQILDVTATPATSDPTARVQMARLEFVDPSANFRDLRDRRVGRQRRDKNPSVDGGEMIPDVNDPDTGSTESNDLTLIILMRTELEFGRTDLDGLALRKVGETQGQTFERVGKVTLRDYDRNWKVWMSESSQTTVVII
ncbi:hypothetical protein MMYC01_204470 [Madurella mycetomatis]|uniref:Heterokaryon incompatibility domain-containing protein n=1 Tax=Madurella mycetomatis TaxID=100816 RepID=A0A175W7G8_9PEZI|nr:hypothetical protein MMYC01_209323 [Madurella mycetomatis]KXX79573.1 hypothetical protein MMYC01_204470 [Madurella mycetomatis]